MMKLSALALAGITLSSICASICPMNLAMHPMDMDGMHMAAQEMDHDDMDTKQGCDSCATDEDHIALANLSVEIQQVAHVIYTKIPSVVSFPDITSVSTAKLFLADTGPPLSEVLVGTVILKA